LKNFEKKNSKNPKIQAAVAGQKSPNNIGNGQGNSPKSALPCPQISSNERNCIFGEFLKLCL